MFDEKTLILNLPSFSALPQSSGQGDFWVSLTLIESSLMSDSTIDLHRQIWPPLRKFSNRRQR